MYDICKVTELIKYDDTGFLSVRNVYLGLGGIDALGRSKRIRYALIVDKSIDYPVQTVLIVKNDYTVIAGIGNIYVAEIIYENVLG